MGESVERPTLRAMTSSSQIDFSDEQELLPLATSAAQGGRPWFVYLFALSDCSAFKVGFSRSPLQRIYAFSRRYFESFDLSQSRLLPVGGCDEARFIEAAI